MSNTRVKGSNQKRSQPNAQQSSESLRLQITHFLDSGGVIDEIPQGVSGQVFTPIAKK
jgi:hypothetical protein